MHRYKFSCIKFNLEVSFINSTLPLVEMNKIFETDVCSGRAVRNTKEECVHMCESKTFLECLLYLMVICYHTKIKLASGDAYNCNDRSGITLKEKLYFFFTF